MDDLQVRAGPLRAEAGWWVQSLTSTLIVGPASLQLLESWSMVAKLPLDEVLVPLHLDLGGLPLRPESVLYGGELSLDPWPLHPGRPEIAVRLPKLLYALDRHDFGLRLEVPLGRSPGHHLCRPAVGCQELEVRVRFLRDVPAAVCLVTADDGPQRLAEWPVDQMGGVVGGVVGEVVGEVVARFTDLAPGAVRGVRWSDGTARR